MIARHRPPQRLRSLMGALVTGKGLRRSMERIEARYARLWNVEHVVWIPSARFGITHAIRQHTRNLKTVYSAAFNCGAVFHAARETGRDVHYVDTQPGSFLMDTGRSPGPDAAVILSEMFGQRFSAVQRSQPLADDAAQRIFDMAMSIPEAPDFAHLRDQDVAVASFGLGKSLYAGWGGLAVTSSAAMASRLRAERIDSLSAAGRLTSLTHDIKVLARMAAHLPLIYGPLRQRKGVSAAPATFIDQPFSRQTHEWQRSVSPLHALLALDNADRAQSWAAQRRTLTERYRTAFADALTPEHLPAETNDALSHFSLRVPAVSRSAIRQQLWQRGIDAATLFPTPIDLCPAAQFPHAHAAGASVLNLPLSTQLTEAHIDRIVRAVRTAVLSVDKCGRAAAERRAA
ncbi:MAG: DegT/DnrJ/EryC1/StrS family aminotransferase [Planctomycetaceae bacterium]|nr:DegT/DnrJ/EryC1/StrS family aminotransferase [Planctomycetaceae bacterium]